MAHPAQLGPIDKARFNKVPVNLPTFDAYVALTGAALLIAFAIAIYLAAMSPGNWPADIALMTAFP